MEKTLDLTYDLRKNITQRLREHAESFPNRIGLIFPEKKSFKYQYEQQTFCELDAQSDSYAYELQNIGISQGTKTILMVKPGIELYTIVFALFKIGAIPVIVDPGMGIQRMLHCYKTVGADAFIGIPIAHLIRILNPKTFSSLKVLVNVGFPFFFDVHNLSHVSRIKHATPKFPLATVNPDDLMIINFTTGSTGPAKGVEYTYKMADSMLNQLVHLYQENTSIISLATVPLFGILDLLIGFTSVLPMMDPTKPAQINPAKILQTIDKFKVSHMFASPAFLHRIIEYGKKHSTQLSSLRCVISGGAPVSKSIVEGMDSMLPKNTLFHITYGATEALPISSILSTEWLAEMQSTSNSDNGTCVGKPVQGLTVRIIQISDTPLKWSDALLLPVGKIGEITLCGPLVSQHYANNKNQNELMKIIEGDRIWHRTGDLGSLDAQGRLWFLGRKSDRVFTSNNTLCTEQVERVFNAHPAVYRSALISIENHGTQIPMLCIELKTHPSTRIKKNIENELFAIAKKNYFTQDIKKIFFNHSFPVDIRHNAKIDRKKLGYWAQYKMNTKTNFKWFICIPLAGWLFLAFGLFWPLNNAFLKMIWWIDCFLSVGVHSLQLYISVPLAKKSGISLKKTIVFTLLLGATWWGLLKPKNTSFKLASEKGS